MVAQRFILVFVSRDKGEKNESGSLALFCRLRRQISDVWEVCVWRHLVVWAKPLNVSWALQWICINSQT